MRLSTFAAFLALALPAGAFAQDAATPASSTAPAAGAAPAASAAAASPAPASAPVGDAARGKPLTYTCQGCHGITGYKNAYPNYHVPRIGGQSAQFLTNALLESRSGARKHPTMQAQAQSFSEQDIADIAAYLSGIDK